MRLDFNSEKPIYLQLAQAIKDDIISGVFEEEGQIPSTTEVSLMYKINPATVGKGYNLLVEEGIIYKRRGVGMFVTKGAREQLVDQRKKVFFEEYVQSMLQEAKKLGISLEDIITMIRRGNNE